MKYSKEQVQQLSEARKNNPQLSSFVDAVRHQFPSAKIVYLETPEVTIGADWPEGVSSEEAKSWFHREPKKLKKEKLTPKQVIKKATRYK
jgi:multidrug efflux pump subunit AcrB